MASTAVGPASVADDVVMPPATSGPAKKSWLEIRQSVRKCHRGISLLANRIPHTFTFQKLSSGGWRVYFLAVPVDRRENTLFYVDFDSKLTQITRRPWCHLLESFNSSVTSNLSREEQLLRERKRMRSLGITAYDYQHSAAGGHFVFSAGNSIYVCLDPQIPDDSSTVPMTEVKTECINSRIDPKLCPSNPDLLAFVSGLDLWVCCISSGVEHRLTHVHKGLKNIANDSLSAGVPSFVVQEEFDRFTGYWWQPVSSPTANKFCILYEEVDESDVDILHIVSPQMEGATCDQYRYPKAGSSNAKCTLKMVEFTLTEQGTIEDVVERKLAHDLSNVIPYLEYIVRVGWLPDGSRVYAEVLNRQQNDLYLVLFDVDCFVDDMSTIAGVSQNPPTAGCMWIVYHETSSHWINVHELLHFFHESSAGELSFIWGSAKSGFMHLYLITVTLDMSASDSTCSSDTDIVTHPCCRTARIVRDVALTSGDWEVDTKQLWVDETREVVYFIGYKHSPLETHLYKVSWTRPGDILLLTQAGYSHGVTIDKTCSVFATVHCSLKTPTACHVHQLESVNAAVTTVPDDGCLVLQTPKEETWRSPELFTFTNSSGVDMHGMVLLPPDADVTQKYPVVLYVYAGPHVQLVTNSYKPIRFPRLYTLASFGFVVVVIDSRGSSHRGVAFEGHIRSCLGQVEITDQVEGLCWLAAQRSYIDMQRVAIHGWSYGGYVSLLGLIQRPDIFKVAVAGAPVTSWHLYDTGYTERYLDLPKVNPTAYKTGSVVDMVDKFPNEEGRLLIVHGLIDENVHFYHTSTLVEALVKACKPHQLQVYPNERHGIRTAEANEHFETVLISFLLKNV